MQVLWAQRVAETNKINLSIEVYTGYTMPMSYSLANNTILPVANTDVVGDAILTYYNSQNTVFQTTWNSNTSPYLAPVANVITANVVISTNSVVNLPQYLSMVQNRVLSTGITVPVSSNTNILSDGTSSTLASLALLSLYGQLNPTGTKTWVDNNGVVTIITGAECVTLATNVGNWVSNTYATVGVVLGEIAANTITTTVEIDSILWPTA